MYVGDVFSAEPISTVPSAPQDFRHLCVLLGFALTPGKRQPPAPTIHLLGADIVFSADQLVAKFPAMRMGDLTNDIRQIIARNQLNPGQAAKLREVYAFRSRYCLGTSAERYYNL